MNYHLLLIWSVPVPQLQLLVNLNCLWLDSNRGSLVSEATAQLTPQWNKLFFNPKQVNNDPSKRYQYKTFDDVTIPKTENIKKAFAMKNGWGRHCSVDSPMPCIPHYLKPQAHHLRFMFELIYLTYTIICLFNLSLICDEWTKMTAGQNEWKKIRGVFNCGCTR